MTVPARPNPDFWQGKHVLVTGHTGFKGSWLSLWLSSMGAKVTGLALEPETNPNLYELAQIDRLVDSRMTDIRDATAMGRVVRDVEPEIVLHLAAQSLVLTSYNDPRATCETNVMGTVNLLEAIRQVDSVRVAVMVTTDKVYANHETGQAFQEGDALGGKDLYSASKAAADIVCAAYRDAFLHARSVAVSTARAGNVVGGGDWAAHRLIADAVRAWCAGEVLSVRSPNATRPWQHVLEPLCGYLVLAERSWEDTNLAGAWNFGPDQQEVASVAQVIELAQRTIKGDVEMVQADASKAEAQTLAIDNQKAKSQLQLMPHWNLPETIHRTMHWYERQHQGDAARTLCEQDIRDYMGYR